MKPLTEALTTLEAAARALSDLPTAYQAAAAAFFAESLADRTLDALQVEVNKRLEATQDSKPKPHRVVTKTNGLPVANGVAL